MEIVIAKEILMVFILIVGLIAIIAAFTVAARASYTVCWKDTLTEWDAVKGSINSRRTDSHDVVMRSGCLKEIKQVDTAECYRACEELRGQKSYLFYSYKDEAEDCMTKCDACSKEDIKACWAVVPEIPSSFRLLNIFSPKEWINTFRERTHKVEVFTLKYRVKPDFPIVPEEGNEEYCVKISRTDITGDSAYSMSSNGGMCV